jgi:hypothetical protein
MPDVRICPRCETEFPATEEFFYRRPASQRLEYCLVPSARNDNARGCHGDYWKTVASRRKAGLTSQQVAEVIPSRSSRQFGVEIEVGLANRELIVTELRRAGVDAWYDSGGPLRQAQPGQWVVKGEHCGSEIVSPPLSGEDGHAQVTRVCAALTNARANVTSACGLHVHHDLEGCDLETIKRLYESWYNVQHQLERCVTQSRRGGQWSRRITGEMLDRLKERDSLEAVRDMYLCRYTCLNMNAYAAHGTVEVRLHQGTRQASQILAWTELGQAMIDVARSGHVIEALDPSETSLEKLLEKLQELGGLSPQTAAFLLAREAQIVRNQQAVNRRREARHAAVYAEREAAIAIERSRARQALQARRDRAERRQEARHAAVYTEREAAIAIERSRARQAL